METTANIINSATRANKLKRFTEETEFIDSIVQKVDDFMLIDQNIETIETLIARMIEIRLRMTNEFYEDERMFSTDAPNL